MKKILMLMLFLALFMVGSAEENWFTATAMSYRTTGQSKFTEWKAFESPLPIMIDFDRKKMIIKSGEEQIIDWVYLEERIAPDTGILYYTSLATDTKYQTIRIQFWFQNTQMVVRVMYSDLEYQYRIPKTNNIN